MEEIFIVKVLKLPLDITTKYFPLGFFLISFLQINGIFRKFSINA